MEPYIEPLTTKVTSVRRAVIKDLEKKNLILKKAMSCCSLNILVTNVNSIKLRFICLLLIEVGWSTQFLTIYDKIEM